MSPGAPEWEDAFLRHPGDEDWQGGEGSGKSRSNNKKQNASYAS